MKKILNVELLDHGIDHAQYFQGCGTAFTDFDVVFTGCGEDFAEAIEDALDEIAMNGEDHETVEKLIRKDEGIKGEWPTSPNAHIDCEPEHDENCDEDCDEWHGHDECELHYYVSIRIKFAEKGTLI